jgi:hypothetical protein
MTQLDGSSVERRQTRDDFADRVSYVFQQGTYLPSSAWPDFGESYAEGELHAYIYFRADLTTGGPRPSCQYCALFERAAEEPHPRRLGVPRGDFDLMRSRGERAAEKMKGLVLVFVRQPAKSPQRVQLGVASVVRLYVLDDRLGLKRHAASEVVTAVSRPMLSVARAGSEERKAGAFRDVGVVDPSDLPNSVIQDGVQMVDQLTYENAPRGVWRRAHLRRPFHHFPLRVVLRGRIIGIALQKGVNMACEDYEVGVYPVKLGRDGPSSVQMDHEATGGTERRG